MKTVLFTSDISGLQLLKPDSLCVPLNRINTEKVKKLVTEARKTIFPIFFQPKDCKTLPWTSDIGISWFYTMIFPVELIACFPHGIINFHAGPPGAHALHKAIQRGDNDIELKWHYCVEQVDAGQTITSKTIPCVGDFALMREELIKHGTEMFFSHVNNILNK